MNAIIEGTLKQYEDKVYTANVAFGLAHVDFLKENQDSEAELRINVNQKADPLNGGVDTTIVHFTMNETYAALVTSSEKVYKSGLNFLAEKMEHSALCANQNVFIPTDKIVYISDKPLFSASAPASGSIDCDGGVDAGTYILAAYKGFGLVLYWTSASYVDVFASIHGATLAV